MNILFTQHAQLYDVPTVSEIRIHTNHPCSTCLGIKTNFLTAIKIRDGLVKPTLEVQQVSMFISAVNKI